MTPQPFELTVTVSHDSRLTAAVRELAVHAAQYAGCSDAGAAAFGQQVEQAVQACFAHNGLDTMVPVVLRRGEGPVEALVDAVTITSQP